LSGRVISGYRGAKPIRGYRKTDRVVVERRQSHDMPDWRLFFVLPAELGFCIADGPYPGVIGLSIFRGCAIVTGKNKQWVLDQAAVFLMKVARELMPLDFIGRLSRCDTENAQLVHPPRREEDDAIQIVVGSGKPLVVMTSRYMRAIVRAGR
jgi:hypothetical protein